jgi:hypothetical protein
MKGPYIAPRVTVVAQIIQLQAIVKDEVEMKQEELLRATLEGLGKITNNLVRIASFWAER